MNQNRIDFNGFSDQVIADWLANCSCILCENIVKLFPGKDTETKNVTGSRKQLKYRSWHFCHGTWTIYPPISVPYLYKGSVNINTSKYTNTNINECIKY